MSNKLRSIKSGIKWTSFSIFGTILAKIIRGLFIPKLLDPISYGTFASIGVFLRYLQFADFGVHANFIKRLPHHHFNGSPDQRDTFINKSFSLICISFLLGALYLGFASFTYSGPEPDFYVNSILLLIPIFITTKLREFYVSYHLGTQDYKMASVATLLSVYANMILTIPGVYFYGALGGVAGMAIAELLTYLYVMNISIMKPKFYFNWNIFSFWRDSIRQFFVSISEVIAATIDQIAIIAFFDLKAYGYYMLGLTFAWVLEALSSIFNDASYPKIVAIVKEQPARAQSLFDSMAFCYISTCTIILAPTIYVIEALVAYYFSSYTEGLGIYPLMLFLGVARGSMSLLRRMYIAMDKESVYISYTIIAVILSVITLTVMVLREAFYDQMITAIVILNLVICGTYYALLVREKSAIFWKIICLVSAAFVFTLIYKYYFREENFIFLKMNTGFLYLIMGTFTFGLFAYTHRHSLKECIE